MKLLCKIGIHRWRHGTCNISNVWDKTTKDTSFDFRRCSKCGLAQEKTLNGWSYHHVLTKICRTERIPWVPTNVAWDHLIQDGKQRENLHQS